jgi:hypothetical protein
MDLTGIKKDLIIEIQRQSTPATTTTVNLGKQAARPVVAETIGVYNEDFSRNVDVVIDSVNEQATQVDAVGTASDAEYDAFVA